jgi:hypothetical protein
MPSTDEFTILLTMRAILIESTICLKLVGLTCRSAFFLSEVCARSTKLSERGSVSRSNVRTSRRLHSVIPIRVAWKSPAAGRGAVAQPGKKGRGIKSKNGFEKVRSSPSSPSFSAFQLSAFSF